MFAYLLIVAELAILYSVFWYVFIREPRPFEIKENLWGYYDQPVTGCGINNPGQFASNQYDGSKKSKHVKRNVSHAPVLLRSSRHGVRRKDNDLKHGWVEAPNPDAKPQSTLGSLLALIADKLTQLSLRLS